MEHFSKIIPDALQELRYMEYANLIILVGGVAVTAFIWKLADIIRAAKGK